MAPSTWGTQTQQHLSAVSCSLAARVYNRPGTVSIRLMAQAAGGLVQQMAKDPRTPCSGLRLQPRRSSRTRGQFTDTASRLLHAHLVLQPQAAGMRAWLTAGQPAAVMTATVTVIAGALLEETCRCQGVLCAGLWELRSTRLSAMHPPGSSGNPSTRLEQQVCMGRSSKGRQRSAGRCTPTGWLTWILRLQQWLLQQLLLPACLLSWAGAML